VEIYAIARALHMLGALGVIAAVGLEGWSLWRLRRATTAEQVRQRLRISGRVGQLGMTAMLTQLASGGYMMATVWGGVPWIAVTLAAMALLILLAMALTRPGMTAIGRLAMRENGPVSTSLRQALQATRLRVSFQARAAIILGIIVLMGMKPDLAASLLIMGAAASLGLASAMLVPRRPRAAGGGYVRG
jgi:hypothetical protein